MSIVTPREYYICDYCYRKSYFSNGFKYTDNSGLNSKCYDMCSDKCMESHKKYLESVYIGCSGTVNQHIKDFVKVNF